MALVLKTALDGTAGQQELSGILQNAKNNILEEVKSKRTNNNIKNLEGQLNNLFYPKGKGKNFSDFLNSIELTSKEETLETIFNKFDFEDKSTWENNYQSNNYIKNTTLTKAIEDLKNVISKIESTPNYINIETLSNALKQCNAYIEEGNEILRQEMTEFFGDKSYLSLSNNDNAVEIINLANTLNKMINNPNRITNDEAGKIFERALARVNFIEQYSEDIIFNDNKSLDLTNYHFGSKPVERGSGNLINFTIKANIVNDNEILDKAKNKYNANFKINEKNMEISYSYNPYAAKQGKMDVSIKLPDEKVEPYRISAKNWMHNGTGDLGNTNIFGGIARSVNGNMTVINAYKLAVLKPEKDQMDSNGDEVPNNISAYEAHDFAKMALKADVAMGLSQKTGYANVLVVNNGKEIKVYDLFDIVKNSNLAGYNEGTIEGAANNAYEKIESLIRDRTNTYLNLMTLALQKMKVTINLSTKSN